MSRKFYFISWIEHVAAITFYLVSSGFSSAYIVCREGVAFRSLLAGCHAGINPPKLSKAGFMACLTAHLCGQQHLNSGEPAT